MTIRTQKDLERAIKDVKRADTDRLLDLGAMVIIVCLAACAFYLAWLVTP